jgi:peptidoglycan glycosyltransferase
VANDGSLMRPYLVDQLRAPDLTVIDQASPAEMSQPVSKEVAGELQQMMQSVVERGTGRKARIDGATVGGKTGTAEVGSNANPHTWFVGYAKKDNRQIAIAVFIKNGGKSGTEGTGTGGDISAPIARQVMAAYLGEQGG